MPRVSVIIPTHSRPGLLPRAVESAKAAGEDVEIIVVDDASTDATAEVCSSLSGIKYVRLDRNQGVAGARNVGVLASSADFIAFLDDDDVRLPGSLDAQVAALESNLEAGFCCCGALFADHDGRLTGEEAHLRVAVGEEVFWSLMQWDFFTLPVTVVVRKSALLRAGLLRARLAGIDDWDLWVRLAEIFPVVIIGQSVGVYRRPTPDSGQGSSDFARDALRALRHQKELLKLPRAAAAPRECARVRRLTKRRFADVLFHRAALWGPRGHYGFAAKHFLTGLRLGPARALRPFVYRQLLASLCERKTAVGLRDEAETLTTATQARRPSPRATAPRDDNETVSVIIATRDRPQLLPRAIESALAAGEDVEVIVVDDASASGETERVCRAYAGVRYLRAERNQRLGGARNIGIVLSGGSFITFLDDDDARLPGSLNSQREALLREPEAGMVYGQALLECGRDELAPEKYPEVCPAGDIFWELLERNFIPCPAAMFRRRMLFRAGLPEDSTPGIEDWDYWLRIAELAPVLAQAFPVAVYRRASPLSGQFTSRAASLVRLITETHREKWQVLPSGPRGGGERLARARRAFSYNMATHLVWETGRALARHAPLVAAENLFTSLALHPAATLRRAFDPSSARFVKRELMKLLG
jgi:glycosyltransferase involved in cell wall biosynthesis